MSDDKKIGRPSKYTQELADSICELLAEAVSLRTICDADDMPSRNTVRRWLGTNEPFRVQYAGAKQDCADFLAEEMLEIADDGRNDWMEKENKDGTTYDVVDHEHIQRSKLRVDTRKWYAGKLRPKVYGERVQQDVTFTPVSQMTQEEKEAEIEALLKKRAESD